MPLENSPGQMRPFPKLTPSEASTFVPNDDNFQFFKHTGIMKTQGCSLFMPRLKIGLF